MLDEGLRLLNVGMQSENVNLVAGVIHCEEVQVAFRLIGQTTDLFSFFFFKVFIKL